MSIRTKIKETIYLNKLSEIRSRLGDGDNLAFKELNEVIDSMILNGIITQSYANKLHELYAKSSNQSDLNLKSYMKYISMLEKVVIDFDDSKSKEEISGFTKKKPSVRQIIKNYSDDELDAMGVK